MKRLNGSDLGARIHDHIAGKTVEMVTKDGTWLIINTTDGHRYRIGWTDDEGPIKGEPYFAGQDVVLSIPGITADGLALM